MMMKKVLYKIPQHTDLEIINRYQVDKTVREQINPNTAPAVLIEQWLAEEKFNDVVTFLCHALPSREAVWWGCLCLKRVSEGLPADQQKALSAAEAWVRDPSEANRRIAEVKAKKAELECAAGWLAQAAFWSGGSITPATAPVSPAPPYLYAHAVAGAICLCAVLPDGGSAVKNYRQMIRIGLDIADGGNGLFSLTTGEDI